jgi:hypothetical protein
MVAEDGRDERAGTDQQIGMIEARLDTRVPVRAHQVRVVSDQPGFDPGQEQAKAGQRGCGTQQKAPGDYPGGQPRDPRPGGDVGTQPGEDTKLGDAQELPRTGSRIAGCPEPGKTGGSQVEPQGRVEGAKAARETVQQLLDAPEQRGRQEKEIAPLRMFVQPGKGRKLAPGQQGQGREVGTNHQAGDRG